MAAEQAAVGQVQADVAPSDDKQKVKSDEDLNRCNTCKKSVSPLPRRGERSERPSVVQLSPEVHAFYSFQKSV